MAAGAAMLVCLVLFLASGSPNHTALQAQIREAQATPTVATTAPLTTTAQTTNAATTQVPQASQATNAATSATPDIAQSLSTFSLEEVKSAFTSGQYDLVYNTFSLGIAAQGAATVFFFFQFSLVDETYRTAMVITGLVTMIAFYHYTRIFNSWTTAYLSVDGGIYSSGVPFNDAYRYVDWLLTVPLLLTELILVMGLPKHETYKQCFKLGSLAALMIVLGYPGEISDSSSTRWIFWALAMIPFSIIVYTLTIGLSASIEAQPAEARGLVRTATYILILSWCTYPVVYIFPMIGLEGAAAHTGVQVGYSVADIIAKPIMGILCWMIASRKTALLKQDN